MTANHPIRMDPDQFLAWEVRQERRYELVDGVIKLMAGATRAHLMVQANLLVALTPRLRGMPCRPFQEMRIIIPNRNYRYADVAVDCGPQAPSDLVATGPSVVFEVESPSRTPTEVLDLIAEYQSVPTVQHVVLLAQTRALARVWTRNSDGWFSEDAAGLEAALPLPALDLIVPMAEIYDGVSFPPPADE
jgi:Uma2 family endonuclease